MSRRTDMSCLTKVLSCESFMFFVKLLVNQLLAVIVLRRVKGECSLYRQSIIQNFTLVNKTGYELDQVYVSPAASKNWHEDILGQDTLADGQNAKITFAPENEICKYDLKVVYTIDKSEVE